MKPRKRPGKADRFLPWFGANVQGAPKVGALMRGLPYVAVAFAGGMSEVKEFEAREIVVNDVHADAINLGRVVLNPSTADAEQEDPTVRRMMGFARSWGCGGLYVVNIFAFRATDPRVMLTCDEPTGGRRNDEAIMDCAQQSVKVIACWGAHGAYLDRGMEVRDRLLSADVPLECFGFTKGGHPKHPLYVRGETRLLPVSWDNQGAADG